MDRPGDNDTEPRARPALEWKPIILIVCPNGLRFWTRFRAILLKMQRDARIMYATSLEHLETAVDKHGEEIAGFIVADAKVMDPEYEALSLRLATLVETPDREWALIFALNFPGEAARYPIRFNRYMEEFFGLRWKISGRTRSRIKLRLREQTLRKMGPRIYRSEYEVCGVFLRGVKQADKLLLATGEFGSEGQPDPPDDWITWYLRPEYETDTTEDDDADHESIAEEEDDGRFTTPVMTEGGNGHIGNDHNASSREEAFHGCWADDELTESEDTDMDEWFDSSQNDGDESSGGSSSSHDSTYSPLVHAFVHVRPRAPSQPVFRRRVRDCEVLSDWVPSDDEGTEMNKLDADCPIAIHEVKTWTEQMEDEEALVRGYIGFVGHYEDNRSMTSLILGMCAVEGSGGIQGGDQ